MAAPVLTANSPSAGYIAWTAFNIQYLGVSYSVPATNTNKKFTYWLFNGGAPTLNFSDTQPALTSDDLLLFLNKSGTYLNVQTADLLDGSLVVSGSIIADALGANSVTAPAILAGTIDATKIQAGTITANEIAAGTITANQLAANVLSAGFVLSGQIQVGQTTWTPQALTFPGAMTLPSGPTFQTITLTGVPTGGTFTIKGNGATSGSIAYNATVATMQTAVRALGGAFVNANVTGAAGSWTVDVPPTTTSLATLTLGTSSLTGGTSPTVVIAAGQVSASFTGNITATSLTVLKDLNLLGNTNQIKGTVTLANGIVTPVTKPSISQGWTRQGGSTGGHSMPFGPIHYGLSTHLTDATALLTSEVYGSDSGIQTLIKATGGQGAPLITGASYGTGLSSYRSWLTGFRAIGGITAVASYYWVLGIDSTRSYGWYLYKIDPSTLNKVAEVLVGGFFTILGRPIVGNDGTNPLIGSAISGGSICQIQTFNPSTLAVSTTKDFTSTFTGSANNYWNFIGEGSYDFGATRDVVGYETYGTYPATTAGNRNSDVNYFPPAVGGTTRGMWWDGTRFWSYNTDGNLYTHGANITAEPITAAYTWYDAVGTAHETDGSPTETFTRACRTYLTITTPPAPDNGVTDPAQVDKANQTGVYATNTVGGTLRLQGRPGVDPVTGATITSLTVDTVNTGSAVIPGSNGFSTATNAPGIFQTAGATSTVDTGVGVKFNGDGSGTIAGIAWDGTGAYTNTKHPVADTGWLRPVASTSGLSPVWGTSWTDFDATADERVAMRRIGKTVRVVGMAKRTAGASGTLLTLAAGCRPPRAVWRPATSAQSWAILSVDATGAVFFQNGGVAYANNAYVGFDISFDTDEP